MRKPLLMRQTCCKAVFALILGNRGGDGGGDFGFTNSKKVAHFAISTLLEMQQVKIFSQT